MLSAYDYQFDGSGTSFPTGGYHPPTLEVSGTADTTSPLTDTEATYFGTPAPKYQALMLGAPHVDFGHSVGPGDRPHRCGVPQCLPGRYGFSCCDPEGLEHSRASRRAGSTEQLGTAWTGIGSWPRS